MIFTEEELIDNLISTSKGCIALCNFVDGERSGLYSASDLKLFVSWWMKVIPYVSSSPFVEGKNIALDALDVLGMDTKHWQNYCLAFPGLNDEGHKPDFHALCHQPNSGKSWQCLTVLDSATFFEAISAEDKEQHLNDLSLDFLPEGEGFFANHTHDVSGSAPVKKMKQNAVLGKPGAVLWFTEKTELLKKLATGKADGVRDFLGLIHHKTNVELIIIEFSMPNATICSRPTSFNAGSHRRFKTLWRNPLFGNEWGCAVDLKRMLDSASDLSGGCEQVCKPLDCAELGDMQRYVIGKTTVQRGISTTDDDESYAKHLLHGRTWGQLKQAALNVFV